MPPRANESLDRPALDALVLRWQKRQDEKARDQVLVALRPLVFWWALRLSKPLGPAAVDDLVQEGMLGVLRAMQDFDPEESGFRNWATWWIEGRMLKYVKPNTGPVRNVPNSATNRAYGTTAVPLEDGGFAANERLAQEPHAQRLGVNGSETELVVVDEAPLADMALEAEESATQIRVAVDRLEDADADLLRRHFFGGDTLADIGRDRGISRERVRQLEERALYRLRRLLSAMNRPALKKANGKRVKPPPSRTEKSRFAW